MTWKLISKDVVWRELPNGVQESKLITDPEIVEWLNAGNVPSAGISVEVDNDSLRRNAYINESDPIFFKAQRGEATMQEWLDKIEEIKSRWP